jgi:hypothetical protein
MSTYKKTKQYSPNNGTFNMSELLSALPIEDKFSRKHATAASAERVRNGTFNMSELLSALPIEDKLSREHVTAASAERVRKHYDNIELLPDTNHANVTINRNFVPSPHVPKVYTAVTNKESPGAPEWWLKQTNDENRNAAHEYNRRRRLKPNTATRVSHSAKRGGRSKYTRKPKKTRRKTTRRRR